MIDSLDDEQIKAISVAAYVLERYAYKEVQVEEIHKEYLSFVSAIRKLIDVESSNKEGASKTFDDNSFYGKKSYGSVSIEVKLPLRENGPWELCISNREKPWQQTMTLSYKELQALQLYFSGIFPEDVSSMSTVNSCVDTYISLLHDVYAASKMNWWQKRKEYKRIIKDAKEIGSSLDMLRLCESVLDVNELIHRLA